MAVSVGVVAICHGYPEHIPNWIQSVRALNRQPDEIVLVLSDQIVIDDLDLDGIKVIGWSGDFAFGDMMNRAFENCNTDWVAWIGIDDRYRPHALDKIDTCEADVLAFGFEYSTGQLWTPTATNPEQILSLHANMIPCGSPVRKWLWERQPFEQKYAPVDDWTFWVGTALSGATYDATLDIDVDYDYDNHWVPNDSMVRQTVTQYLIDKREL